MKNLNQPFPSIGQENAPKFIRKNLSFLDSWKPITESLGKCKWLNWAEKHHEIFQFSWIQQQIVWEQEQQKDNVQFFILAFDKKNKTKIGNF